MTKTKDHSRSPCAHHRAHRARCSLFPCLTAPPAIAGQAAVQDPLRSRRQGDPRRSVNVAVTMKARRRPPPTTKENADV